MKEDDEHDDKDQERDEDEDKGKEEDEDEVGCQYTRYEQNNAIDTDFLEMILYSGKKGNICGHRLS